jgi:hypothetical protein
MIILPDMRIGIHLPYEDPKLTLTGETGWENWILDKIKRWKAVNGHNADIRHIIKPGAAEFDPCPSLPSQVDINEILEMSSKSLPLHTASQQGFPLGREPCCWHVDKKSRYVYLVPAESEPVSIPSSTLVLRAGVRSENATGWQGGLATKLVPPGNKRVAFEVTIVDYVIGEREPIRVGWTEVEDYKLQSSSSVCYQTNGVLRNRAHVFSTNRPICVRGDVITCLIDQSQGKFEFFKNGVFVGSAPIETNGIFWPAFSGKGEYVIEARFDHTMSYLPEGAIPLDELTGEWDASELLMRHPVDGPPHIDIARYHFKRRSEKITEFTAYFKVPNWHDLSNQTKDGEVQLTYIRTGTAKPQKVVELDRRPKRVTKKRHIEYELLHKKVPCNCCPKSSRDRCLPLCDGQGDNIQWAYISKVLDAPLPHRIQDFIKSGYDRIGPFTHARRFSWTDDTFSIIWKSDRDDHVRYKFHGSV